MAKLGMNFPQIVTANDLFDGDVVYMTAQGGWSLFLGDAAIAREPDYAAALLSKGAAQQARIVGAYLADVALDDDGLPQPVHFREVFRAKGPSNHFHGKQVLV